MFEDHPCNLPAFNHFHLLGKPFLDNINLSSQLTCEDVTQSSRKFGIQTRILAAVVQFLPGFCCLNFRNPDKDLIRIRGSTRYGSFELQAPELELGHGRQMLDSNRVSFSGFLPILPLVQGFHETRWNVLHWLAGSFPPRNLRRVRTVSLFSVSGPDPISFRSLLS